MKTLFIHTYEWITSGKSLKVDGAFLGLCSVSFASAIKFIHVDNVLNAFLVGAAGSLGGYLIRLLFSKINKKQEEKKDETN